MTINKYLLDKNGRFVDPEDTTLDGILKMLDNWEYSCSICKHLHADEISCAAYPDTIPSPIIRGHVRHTKPMYGQSNDIVFEAADKADQEGLGNE